MQGIGIDIVEIDRIERAIVNHRNFLNRLFTETEINYYKKKGSKTETIAGLFAAKEAISKVLGTGISGFSWLDIEIDHTDKGQPIVILKNEAKKISNIKNIDNIIISISHCKTYAVANAIGYNGGKNDFK